MKRSRLGKLGVVLIAVACSIDASIGIGGPDVAGAATSPVVVVTAVCANDYVPGFGNSYESTVEVDVRNMPPEAQGLMPGSTVPNTFFKVDNAGYTNGAHLPLYVGINGTGTSGTNVEPPLPLTVTVGYEGPSGPVYLPAQTVNATLQAVCGTQAQSFLGSPPGTASAPVVGMATSPDGKGYWMATADGHVYSFGDAANYQASGSGALMVFPNLPIVGIAATPDGHGYWLVASDGGIFTFGDATFYGSTGAIRLNRPIVGMSPTADGKGYWLVASDGGIFSFGDANFQGSMGESHLNQPIVGMAVDQATGGYWLVAADGGIFSFNAPFFGSTGNIHLNQPIVGMESIPDGSGYRFVASDGGVFCFNAPFEGSTGNIHLNQPVTAMAASGAGGYWLVARDGGVFSFNSPFYGSVG